MDAKKLKNSSSSQSPARNESQAIIPNAPVQPHDQRTYPCRYCPKTFSSSSALGGHMNGHKSIRASAKKAETPVAPPGPCRYCDHWRNLAMEQRTTNFTGERPYQYAVASASPPPVTPMGFRDFLGVSSAPEAIPEGVSGGRVNAINLEDDEDDAAELDLDLKL